MTATWGEHQPAYYVATHTEKKEVVVAVRGTWAVEDVVTDITALPVVTPLPLTSPICFANAVIPSTPHTGCLLQTYSPYP